MGNADRVKIETGIAFQKNLLNVSHLYDYETAKTDIIEATLLCLSR